MSEKNARNEANQREGIESVTVAKYIDCKKMMQGDIEGKIVRNGKNPRRQ